MAGDQQHQHAEGLSAICHVRPSTPMELMDRAFLVVRARFPQFLLLGFLFALPEFAATVLFTYIHGVPDDSELAQQFLGWLSAAFLLQQLPNAVVILLAIQAFMFPRRPIRLVPLTRAALINLPLLILTRILAFIILFLLANILLGALGGELGSPGSLLGLFVASWVGAALAYLFLMWMLMPPVALIESRGFFRGLGRSVELMKQRFRAGWPGDLPVVRLLGILLVPGIGILLGQLVVQGTSYALTGTNAFFGPTTPTVFLISAGVNFITKMSVECWMYVAVALLYLECRMRREGLDLQVRLLQRQGSAAGDNVLAGL
ncbi:MAG: hypothetical protein K1X53_02675 [Candidatus Sumerlaeaceae bacterium]|nr:hypothetical protein [Candidatus Sumerlaeaceae bacterium]